MSDGEPAWGAALGALGAPGAPPEEAARAAASAELRCATSVFLAEEARRVARAMASQAGAGANTAPLVSRLGEYCRAEAAADVLWSYTVVDEVPPPGAGGPAGGPAPRVFLAVRELGMRPGVVEEAAVAIACRDVLLRATGALGFALAQRGARVVADLARVFDLDPAGIAFPRDGGAGPPAYRLGRVPSEVGAAELPPGEPPAGGRRGGPSVQQALLADAGGCTRGLLARLTEVHVAEGPGPGAALQGTFTDRATGAQLEYVLRGLGAGPPARGGAPCGGHGEPWGAGGGRGPGAGLYGPFPREGPSRLRSAQEHAASEAFREARRPLAAALLGGAAGPGAPGPRAWLQDRAPCADEHPDCAFWARIGECRANPPYMLQKCLPSCGLCPPPDRRGDFWRSLSGAELASALAAHLRRRTAGECAVGSHGPHVFEVCPGDAVRRFTSPAGPALVMAAMQVRGAVAREQGAGDGGPVAGGAGTGGAGAAEALGSLLGGEVREDSLGRFSWHATAQAAGQGGARAAELAARGGGAVRVPAHTQVFAGGGPCGGGGEGASWSSQLHLVCRSGLLDEAVPDVSVRRLGECQYAFVVATRDLCEVPGMDEPVV